MMATQLLTDEIGIDDEDKDSIEKNDSELVPNARSALERFMDGFFHPANIKWMLLVGATIVLGSSLMLVTKQWSDWSAAIKFVAMLGYTAAIWFFAEFADRRLALKTTGKVLRGLTILLLPVLMFALGWVATQPSSLGLPLSVEVGALFLPTIALLALASTRIFDHFLRGHQITFVASYMLLSVAGVLPRFENALPAIACMAIFWSVLTVGVIKVNRHVFWLTEEHRMPRIFGFFPILLLGSQFLFLCATKVQFMSIPQWYGLATVMLAGTILATTRSIASVFRERTGDLVRPLPWSIALPLFVGVFLTFAGVCLSFYGFRFVGTTTYAVVPTATVACCLLFAVAFDTRHWVFTVLSLVLLTVAYQCTPTLIAPWVHMLKEGAAAAMREEKLPIAFYGITYFPLLAVLTVAGTWLANRRRTDMSLPIQCYVTIITSLLWCVSFSNLKALLIVSAINVVSYAIYAIAFRDRRYAYAALLGTIIVAANWVPFANALYRIELPYSCVGLSLTTLALFFYGSRLVDRLIERIPLPASGLTGWGMEWDAACSGIANRLGLAMIAGLGGFRMVWLCFTPQSLGVSSSLGLDMLLVFASSLIAFRKLHYFAALGATMLPVLSAVSHARYMGWTFTEIVDCSAVGAAALSIVGMIWMRWANGSHATPLCMRCKFGLNTSQFRAMAAIAPNPNWKLRLAQWMECHGLVVTDVATCLTACLGLTVFAPNVLMFNMAWKEAVPLSLATSCVAGWLVISMLVARSRLSASAIALIGPLYASALMVSIWPQMLASQWTPVVWVGFASGLCMLFHFFARAEFAVACFICRVWLCAISAIGLVYLSHPIRIAVAIAVSTLLYARGHLQLRGEPMFIAILCNIHAFLFVVNLTGVEGWIFQDYSPAKLIAIVAALLPTATLSVVISDQFLRRVSVLGAEFWSANLRLFALLLFVIALAGPVLPGTEQMLIMLAVAMAVVGEMMLAIRGQKEFRAWTTLVAIAFGGVWAWDQGWIALGSGVSQLVFVVLAAIAWWLSVSISNMSRFGCFAKPLSWIGLLLPGIASAISIVSEVMATMPIPGWIVATESHSLNYLGLIAAAALYFFRGLDSGKHRFMVIAAGLLNVGLGLLWYSNGLTDPQFYCVPIGLSIILLVELLKKELPGKSRDPLRYAGALFILVSPVVGILGSGWLHLFSLLVLSVLVILLAIGLRIRALMFTGSAFLLADLAGMLIRSTMDNTTLLWVGGVGLGVAVIALAALCENHRENVLSKIRMISAELATWN